MQKQDQYQLWRDRLNDYKTSGKSKSAWCREKNINLKTFSNWFSKFKISDQPNDKSLQWIPVKVSESVINEKTAKINIKIGAVLIELDENFNAELLAKVVKTLVAVC